MRTSGEATRIMEKTMTVTLKNLSLFDIARIGRFMDDYNEK
jgi:hypothetical protein